MDQKPSAPTEGSWDSKWEIVRPLGEGGQGTVYLVRRLPCGGWRSFSNTLGQVVTGLSPGVTVQGHSLSLAREMRELIFQTAEANLPENLGALKVLHRPEGARDPARAEARMAREIEAMSSISDPNLLSLIDYDKNELWYVSPFHQLGTLCQHPTRYQGDLQGTLRAIRPIAHAVAQLHSAGIVHRDIKPMNVFLADDGRLVLGDFGLVFTDTDDTSRLSATQENVGTHAWMPPWAEHIRLEDVRPSFDVFSLGKLLWAMISGQSLLRLWYWYKPEFNVADLFPGGRMDLANAIFERTIVEDEANCLPDAGGLVRLIDDALRQISIGSSLLADDLSMPCRVCGRGSYRLIARPSQPDAITNFGVRPTGNSSFRIMCCNHCGHAALFFFPDLNSPPPAWT